MRWFIWRKYKNLIKFHIKNKNSNLNSSKYKNPKGILTIDKKLKIKNIKEKPLEFINGDFLFYHQIYLNI